MVDLQEEKELWLPQRLVPLEWGQILEGQLACLLLFAEFTATNQQARKGCQTKAEWVPVALR